MNKSTAVLCSLLFGGFATARAAYDIGDLTDPTKYVQLETSDSSTFSSITNGEHWSTHKPPEAGLKYFVPSDKTIASPLAKKSSATFKGDILVIAGDFSMFGHNDAYLNIPHFTMFHGTQIGFGVGERSGRSYWGELTVDPQKLGGNSGDYIDMRTSTGNNLTRIQDLNYALVGPSGAHIKMGLKNTTQKRVGFRWVADNTHYCGTLEATGGATVLGLGASDMPGSVVLSDGAHLVRAKDLTNTIGSLTLAAGTTFECASVSTLTVTNALTVGSGVTLDLGSLLTPTSIAATPAKTNDVLTLTATATGDLDAGDFVPVYDKVGPFPGIDVSVADGGDAAQTLRVVSRQIVAFPKNASVTAEQVDETLPGVDYAFDGTKTSTGDSAYSFPGLADETFKGETLYLTNAANFVGTKSGSVGLSVPNLYLAGSSSGHLYGVSTFQHRNAGAYYLRGGMTVDPGYSGSWLVRGSKFLLVDSQVSGGGDLFLKTTGYGGKSNCNGSFEFTALNTNYTGRIRAINVPWTATKSGDAGDAPTESLCVNLHVTDGRNLGGPLDTWTYDALTIGNWSKLLVSDNDVTLGQANRGVFVTNDAQIVVADGKTLTVGNPLTMSGVLHKKGAGTLALGAGMRFTDGEETSVPVQDENVIQVKAGWIKPLATNALDGAAIAFGAGTGLRLDLAPTAEGLAARGFVNVKTGGSVGQAVGATGKIALAFDGGEVTGDVTLGVATLPSRTAAEALQDNLLPVRPLHCRVQLAVVDNDDGTATVQATVTRTGFMLILR